MRTSQEAHSGETERAAALDTLIENASSSLGSQTQNTQQNAETRIPQEGVGSAQSGSGLGPQQQSTQPNAETRITPEVAGPQTQSSSTGQFDKVLETMNNMAAAMASQAQGLAASAPSVGLSSLRSMTVDTKGILTVEDYWGEKDKFLGWKRVLY